MFTHIYLTHLLSGWWCLYVGAAYWVVQWAMGVFSQYMDNLNILFKKNECSKHK